MKGRLLCLSQAVLMLFFLSQSPAIIAEELESDSIQLETVVVTAHKNKERKQDIPANISVVDSKTMEDFNVEKLDTLTGLIPNVSVNRIQNQAGQIVFRGIGGMTNMNKVFNINVDGVTIPYAALDTFLDISQVEILRGGQSSLYGRNTHAGVVNIITTKPTHEFTFDAGIDYGSYNTSKVKTAFGGPLGDQQAYRIALSQTSTDGYMENESLDTTDGSRYQQNTGRFIYDYTTSNDTLIRFSVIKDSYAGGFDEFFVVADGVGTTTKNNEEGETNGDLISPTLTVESQLNGLKLTSITNYSNSNSHVLYDMDFSMMDLILFEYDEEFTTVTQEFRLIDDDSEAFKWLLGVFFMQERLESLTDVSFGDDAAMVPGMMAGLRMIGDGAIESQGIALFGQMSFLFQEKFELRTRLRLDQEHRELTWKGNTELNGMAMVPEQDYTRNDDWLGVMPALSVSYLPTQDQRIYASIDRGYKVGDYAANQTDINAVKEPVDPEYTMTYEIGYKAMLADRTLEISCALFYIDWTDMHVSVVKDSVALMQNAAEAHASGFEFEARWRPIQGLDLFTGLGLLDGEFDRYDNHPDGLDLIGNALPNSHDYNFSLGAVYRQDQGMFASVSANMMGPKFMDELNDVEQEAYTLLNAKAGYKSDSWSFYLYGRNLLNEEYLVHTFLTAGRIGEPAVIGGQVNYLF